MRKAVIDLGTNTFNLIIAEVDPDHFELLYSTKIGVGIGLGGINNNQLTPDAQQRALDALKSYKKLCDEYQVENITALGTSAIRDAENGEEFTRKVKAQLGIDICVISGETEAELIYNGVLWSYDFEEPALIMDIGGGSTEFILADQEGIQKKISLNIGISRIFQAIETEDPLNFNDILTIEQWLDDVVKDQLDGFESPILIGASGSFETFYEMIHLKDSEIRSDCYQFDTDELHRVLDWLIQSDKAQRELHPNIIPIRKLMGPVTAVKTKWILKKLNVRKIWMSPFSMKEGALNWDMEK